MPFGSPKTATRTDHAISIFVDGESIGQIQDWNPSQGRTVTPAYEIDADTSGTVVENVPGNITGLTITVNRFDLYTAKMEQVWGANFDIIMLTDQSNSIQVRERWVNPSGKKESYVYEDCWFSSLGRTHSANGDRITKVNATMMYARKKKAA